MVFPSKTPSLEKKALSQTEDENGYPVLEWQITVNNLYELDKYIIEDNMLAKAIDGSFYCQNDILRLENGKLVYDDKVNTVTPFVIKYKTKVTAEEMSEHNEAFEVSNTVQFKGDTESAKTDKFIITPENDSQPISKIGTQDYFYTGSRSDENAETNYIYWEAEVRKNYGASLAGTEINDTTTKTGTSDRIAPELVAVYDADGTALDGVLTATDTGWTVKSDVTQSYLKLVYRTPADNKASYNNTISIGTKSKTSGPITYDLSQIRTITKTASPGYDSQENDDGTVQEWVDWTITIDASTQNSNEIINGYVIEDTAFVAGKYQLLSAQIKTEGKSNYETVDVNTVLTSDGDKKLKITDTHANMKYLSLTYRVPLNSTTPGLTGDRSANDGLGDNCKLSNTYTVEVEGSTVEIPIPGIGGRTTVNVGKNWMNDGDPDKDSDNLTATFQLQKQVLAAGETLQENGWTDVAGKTITVKSKDGQTYHSFTDLPEYEINATTNGFSKDIWSVCHYIRSQRNWMKKGSRRSDRRNLKIIKSEIL